MADIAGIRVVTATLVASTVDRVTLSGGQAKRAELINAGTDLIWYRLDGVDPIVAAAAVEILLPSERLSIALPESGEVRLISTGTPTYSVVVTG